MQLNILVYLYYPFFDNHLAGGVQVWMRKISEYIVQYSSKISLSIVCPKSNLHNFPSHIKVYPVLNDIEQDYINPMEVLENMRILRELSREMDIIWLIDRTFPIKTDKPKVLTLNTICYERELNSFFYSGWYRMVAVSNFEKELLPQFAYDNRNIDVIPLFIDPIFKIENTSDFSKVNKYFEYDITRKYLLFPHRAEKEKGHDKALQIVKELVKHNKDYILLIPTPGDSKMGDYASEYEYMETVKKKVSKLGLVDNVVFH